MNRLEQLKMYDVITFEDGEKVMVLARCDYNSRVFVYVNEVLPDESDITDVYKVMEVHLEDGTLEKIVEDNLLREIVPLLSNIDKFTYDYFYNLIDRLVKWKKKDEYCSLDIYGIYVSKDYEGSNEYIKRMHVAGYLGDSETDMSMFLNMRNRNKHPNDIKFSGEVFEWFEVGKPRDTSTYEIYQDIGTFKNDEELVTAMQFLEKDVKRKYPNFGIKFYTPEINKTGGCYIATAVYGSYNCPEVWTLRRFRDEVLSTSHFGRQFISFYYAISPRLVGKYGKNKFLISLFRSVLDKVVKQLNKKGIDDTFYMDK